MQQRPAWLVLAVPHADPPGEEATLKIEAIVPTLQEAHRLEACLTALRAAGVTCVHVVDGGSRDDTRERAALHGAIVHRARAGRAIQLNTGARHSQADVLWFVHADSCVPLGALAAIQDALQDPDVVGGAFRTRTVPDRPSLLSPLLPFADIRSHYTHEPYGDQAIFVRREVFERLGGFPMLPLMEDLAFSKRMWTVGRVVRLPDRVEVSGRRYLARPVVTSIIMNTFPVFFRLGVAPRRLARWYDAIR